MGIIKLYASIYSILESILIINFHIKLKDSSASFRIRIQIVNVNVESRNSGIEMKLSNFNE